MLKKMLFYVFLCNVLFTTTETYAQNPNETLPTGSFIVNMGITPVTRNNSLRPYGMIYDLVSNYEVPVKWIINSSKARNGVDFTHNSTAYSGGPFIIPGNFITATVQARITYWQGQGIIGAYTTTPITVPVFYTITYFGKAIIDNDNPGLVTPFYTNASIPATAYTIGNPSVINECNNFYALPHADPSWFQHNNLYDFVTTRKGSIWAGCHAVSVLESSNNPNPPYQQLNFLTTNGFQCYKAGECGPITEVHAANPASPYTYHFPSDPINQYIGNSTPATENGSEKWYIPRSTGRWNSNARRLITSNDGASPREGVKMVYGRAFDNPANGYVMYEAGHSVSGTNESEIAASRAYLNFTILASITNGLEMNVNIPAVIDPGTVHNLSVTVSGGTPPYTYKWTNSCGGTFGNATSASTTFSIPYSSRPTVCELRIVVTDACSRRNIYYQQIPVNTTLPVSLISFKGKSIPEGNQLEWLTGSELNNDFFEIQKLDTETNNYYTLARAKGAGNSSKPVSYNLLDKTESQNKVSYYKLLQFDYDGKYTEYDPIGVHESAKSDFKILIPYNILNRNSYVQVNAIKDLNLTFKINDLQGKQVFKEVFLVEKGVQVVEYATDLPELTRGIYLLTVYDGTFLQSTKLLYINDN